MGRGRAGDTFLAASGGTGAACAGVHGRSCRIGRGQARGGANGTPGNLGKRNPDSSTCPAMPRATSNTARSLRRSELILAVASSCGSRCPSGRVPCHTRRPGHSTQRQSVTGKTGPFDELFELLAVPYRVASMVEPVAGVDVETGAGVGFEMLHRWRMGVTA